MRVEQVVDIPAPADRVWGVLCDLRGWPTWTASMREVTPLRPGPVEPGLQVRVVQPRLPTTVWTVEEVVPGRSFRWSSRSPGIASVGDHVLEPTATGCRVTLSLAQTGPLAPAVGVLLGRLTRRYVRMEAVGLRARCEADPQPGS